MYYTHSELLKKYRSDYQIQKAVINHEIKKIRRGLYSDGNDLDETAAIFTLRDDVVLTLQSAFFYHGLTDYIPDEIVVATPKNAYPIQLSGIRQIFLSNAYYSIGIMNGIYEGYSVQVYDLERTLIELIRYQTKIPFEEYYHVLRKFRDIKDQIDFPRLLQYASYFRSSKKIFNVIENSIM